MDEETLRVLYANADPEGDVAERAAAFDQWLRAVQGDAWEEGWAVGVNDRTADSASGNPYR